jgi:hypothetical protein
MTHLLAVIKQAGMGLSVADVVRQVGICEQKNSEIQSDMAQSALKAQCLSTFTTARRCLGGGPAGCATGSQRLPLPEREKPAPRAPGADARGDADPRSL